jgi:serine/threonine-protein phosphatase 2A regulatory subunit B'
VEVVPALPPPQAGKRRSTTLLHLLSLEKPDGVFVFAAADAVKLPPPSPEPEAESLINKIESCRRVFTFAATEHCADERELKRSRLAEILAAVRSSAKSQPPGLYHRVMSALARMLPPALLLPSWSRGRRTMKLEERIFERVNRRTMKLEGRIL